MSHTRNHIPEDNGEIALQAPADALEHLPARLAAALVLFAAYAASARIGLRLSFKPDFIGALWPPNAVLLSALLLTRPRHWWYLLAAAVPAELAADIPQGIAWPTALAFVGADMAEALTGALLLGFALKAPIMFRSLRETTLFMVCCMVVAPLVSAFPGAATTLVSGSDTGYWIAWRTWFMGDALTQMTMTPFLIILFRTRPLFSRNLSILRVAEAITLCVLLIAVSCLVFSSGNGVPLMGPSMLYIPMPLLLWAAVRFGSNGIFTASISLVFITIWYASNGAGPFTSGSPAGNVLTLQIYFMLALLPLYLLAAIIHERNQAQSELRSYQKHLENLVEDRTRTLQKTQKQLIESERLAVLGQFAGSVAHEIRNPLSVIVNCAHYLKKSMIDADGKTRSYLDKIQERSLHTAELINSIQRMARLEPPQKTRCDAVAIVKNVCQNIHTPENIRCEQSYLQDPLFADLDARHIELAVKNLLRNAIQAMPDGGALAVEVGESGDQRFRISVSDTGEGISEEALQNIFTPMYTTRIYGIGFGLSIVKMIADEHGGAVAVQSQLGRGSTFTLTLPK